MKTLQVFRDGDERDGRGDGHESLVAHFQPGQFNVTITEFDTPLATPLDIAELQGPAEGRYQVLKRLQSRIDEGSRLSTDVVLPTETFGGPTRVQSDGAAASRSARCAPTSGKSTGEWACTAASASCMRPGSDHAASDRSRRSHHVGDHRHDRGDHVADGHGPVVAAASRGLRTGRGHSILCLMMRRLRAWRVTPRSFAASTMLPVWSSATRRVAAPPPAGCGTRGSGCVCGHA